MRNKSNKGFTLIELLIVIAIIGILAAVLIPNLLSARNRANDTAAQAYLRQAVTSQEINQVDNNVYTDNGADELEDLGLGELDANDPIAFNVVAADATGYCMTASHAGGSGVVFFATASGGLQDDNNDTVCTVAE